MLCTLFASRLAHLEREHPMRLLSDVTRSARRARKAYALAATHYADAETDKAQRRAARRTKAARRALLETARAADAMDDWQEA